nr:nitroreductase family protein [Virgisporangium ochraceum]
MILRRNRVPMPHADFVPNWADKPRPTKHYPGALTFPLPDAAPESDGPQGTFTLPVLASMLRDSYGLTGRRLAIQANTDVHGYPWYARANWSRGTASGGGLYPCSIYWVAGPGARGGGRIEQSPDAGVCPGVYHYSIRRHAMQRLLAGDVTRQVRDALTVPVDASQFLVVGVKYWANAFKYNTFSYHAVSMDVGTVLQTWRQLCGDRRPVEPHFWFDQEALGRLLGLPADEEGLFAVVPLPWSTRVATETGPAPDGVAVRRRDEERSRVVLTFDPVRRIHRTTARAATDRPVPGALAAAAATAPPAGGDRVALPPAPPPTMPVRDALARRRSSFGRFDASRALSTGDLAALLVAAHVAHLPTEVAAPGDGHLAKLYVFVNHVRGVAPGSYAYDPARHDLRPIRPGPPGMFLQRNYFLPNYNLEQAAVVVVPAVRVGDVLDAVGPRGYNVVNATIGAVAQSFYTAAAALDLGCGVALGFDGVSYIEELDLDGTGETPLLIMLAGHERALPSDYRYDLR